MSNDGFAAHLGVSSRTIAAWHKKADLVPRPELQQALDTALDLADDGVKARFAQLASAGGQPPTPPGTAQAFRVAIAIVVNGTKVVIVCRRGEDGGGISWQFPAGIVKPGVSPETVAVRETLAETNVHCTVVRSLGSRLHPITNVMCDYLLCEYLAGDAENVDVVENVSVTWTDRTGLTRFIPADRIFAPVLEALEVASDSADS
ncbi:MAG TPA: NUDIX hydrolase [Actinophytocola sp.]|jgi:8-oxo-dGTP pyrophosphatase MutT (NUDIX family)|nr:NUDIX hydrolase [Actinophytocola sp.]